MKRNFFPLLLIFALLAVNGCGGVAEKDAISLPDGPAMVMVYKDN